MSPLFSPNGRPTEAGGDCRRIELALNHVLSASVVEAKDQLFLRGFFGSQIEMDGGREDEREDHGTQNAADHGDSERLQHCRAGADAECQREHAGDSGQSRHGNGAQTAAARLDHGFFGGKTEAAGAEKVRNSKSSTANRSSSAKNNTTNKSLDDFRSSAYRPPYSTRMDEGRRKLLTAL